MTILFHLLSCSINLQHSKSKIPGTSNFYIAALFLRKLMLILWDVVVLRLKELSMDVAIYL